jgi:hypothetical protein
VGRLGIDADDLVSLGIGPNHEGLAAVLPVSSGFSRLYFIDLASGDATDLGQIGAAGEQIVGLVIQRGPVCARTSTLRSIPDPGEGARPPRLRRAASPLSAAIPYHSGRPVHGALAPRLAAAATVSRD